MALQFLNEYKIPQTVPIDGSASYAEIARKINLDETFVKRYIRYAISIHVFDEDDTGAVIHTVLSRELAENPHASDAINHWTKDICVATNKSLQALQRWGVSPEPNQTMHNVAFNSTGTLFETLMEDPVRASYLGGTMKYATSGDSWAIKHILKTFDWASIDRPGAVAVDIGGSMGHLSIFLAENTQHLNFVVQDLPHVAVEAQAACPNTFRQRITFEGQDFLTPQTLTQSPDLYFMRFILHDWSDQYATRILKSLVPGMSKKTKLLIMETLLKDGPSRKESQKINLQLDLAMIVLCNGRERTVNDFKSLLAAADQRYVFEGINDPPESTVKGVVVGWNPDA
jgi:hypothetical protein